MKDVPYMFSISSESDLYNYVDLTLFHEDFIYHWSQNFLLFSGSPPCLDATFHNSTPNYK